MHQYHQSCQPSSLLSPASCALSAAFSSVVSPSCLRFLFLAAAVPLAPPTPISSSSASSAVAGTVGVGTTSSFDVFSAVAAEDAVSSCIFSVSGLEGSIEVASAPAVVGGAL